MIVECPRCSAHIQVVARLVEPDTQEKVLDWPVDAESIARRVREETEQRSGGVLSPDDRVAVESVVTEIFEEAAEAGALTADAPCTCSVTDNMDPPDEDCPWHGRNAEPEPPPPPLARHPQVPEADWAALNREQQADVVERLERVAKLNIIAGDPDRHPTDIAAANRRIGEALGDLRDDYDFELLPAEDVMEADAAVRDKTPPPRISEQSPRTPLAVLQARRTYLRAKVGLPAEAEEDRQLELAEIESRLRAQGAAV